MSRDPFEGVIYKKNFLKQVIARVDLLSPLRGVEGSLPSSLGDAAKQAFPIPEPRDAIKRQVKLGPEAAITQLEERFKEWRFHGRERTKLLTISKDAVFVEHTAYERYELVKEEFVRIIDRVRELYPDTQVSRLGLRYINVIELNEPHPTDWSGYIAAPLLYVFQFPPGNDQSAFARVLHNLELAFDSFNLRYQFGMHNPDYPARIRQKAFVLDLDAYTQTAADLRDVGPFLDQFHGTIQGYFEHSITEGLRRLMNAT